MSKNAEIRINCNPHNFLLFKRMIEFEITGSLQGRAKLTDVTDAILNCSRIDEHQKQPVISYTKRPLWNGPSFSYVERHLDELCKVVTKLGEFKSWSDFTNRFSKWRSSIKAAAFTEFLPEDKLYLVTSWVERDLGKIYDRRMQEGKLDKPKHNLKINGLDFAEFDLGKQHYHFSYSGLQGIEKIATLAKAVYPCPINDFNVKRPWFEKNEYIFIMCEDDCGELIANMNVLPLKDQFCHDLKNGKIYENDITADDIYSQEEKDFVNFIYLEGFASLSVYVQHKYRELFPTILGKLANLKNPNLTICAIGGSDEGDAIMKRAGFTQTGKAVDHRTGETYPFLEIKWSLLQNILIEKIAISRFSQKLIPEEAFMH